MPITPYTPLRWIDNPDHRHWLADHTNDLYSFYESHVADRRNGGFFWLDNDGQPMRKQGKHLWINARMVHCFAIGSLLGRPGSSTLVQHGLDYLTDGPLRDHESGGWLWHVNDNGTAIDDSKQAYGHAFVLLAACSAMKAGFDTTDLFDTAWSVLDERFWRVEEGAFADTWDRNFEVLEDYRGQNANMHLTEALMSAAETTGETRFTDRAVQIANLLIKGAVANNEGRLPEHFNSQWEPLYDYNSEKRDNLFRPFGSTVGHWLEWSRLLLQLDAMVGSTETAWMQESAATMFDQAVEEAWDTSRGGFIFTVDRTGNPVIRDRYHWVIAEAIGAACYLYRATGDPRYEEWYRRFWDHAAQSSIDRKKGSWWSQLDEYNQPASSAWVGKADLYHSLQATMYPRVPLGVGITDALSKGI